MQSYRELMPFEVCRRIHSLLEVLRYEEDSPEQIRDMGPGLDKQVWIRRWVHAYKAQFKRVWDAGTHLTIDKQMVFWTGLGDAHLSYIPRKPFRSESCSRQSGTASQGCYCMQSLWRGLRWMH